jgi:hypothetical protein
MGALLELVQTHGFDPHLLELRGHGQGEHNLLRSVHSEIWLDQAMERIRALSPRLLLGYSLGASTLLEALERAQVSPRPEFGVWIAPSFGARWFSSLSSLIAPFAPGWVLPGKSPPEYRAGPGTAVAAYAAHEQIRKALWSRPQLQFAPSKNLVFLGEGDELISAERGGSFARSRLPSARIVSVSKDQDTVRPRRLHLFVDEPTAGPPTWAKICKEIEELTHSKII